jgi:D-3-phosphoglycerate dehydrogenase
MAEKLKVVVTDYEYASLHFEKEEMRKIGADLVPCQCRNEEDLIANTRDADGLFVQYARITRRVMENLRQCKAIVVYGIGVDGIDVKAATDHGIMVMNVPDYGIQDVADHTIALLLAAARKIVTLNNSIKSGTWNFNLAKPLRRLEGKVLGLVAFGNIARVVALRARPFGFRIQVFDPYLNPGVAAQFGVTAVDLSTLFSTSDFICLHAPLTDATRHLVNAELLNRVKPSAILINTARGGLVDEAALIEALRSGRLAGAALDVMEKEPANPDNPLLRMENVIITPHAAWYTEEGQDILQCKAARHMARALTGEIPENILNPECLKR